MPDRIEQLLTNIDGRLQVIEKNQVESSIKLKTIHERGCFRGEERILEIEKYRAKEIKDIHKRIDGQRNIAGVAAGVTAALAAIWSYLSR